jgi:glycosyltransferase involved in cell wall biosynthesis
MRRNDSDHTDVLSILSLPGESASTATADLDRAADRPAEAPAGLTLSIIIPAYNEEEAIASIIERCQAAIPEIQSRSPVTDVEIVVVSDGSTDRTAEIARGFQGIRLIDYRKNRGYGAAILEGWRRARGDLLAFLDADGTCDPLYFIDMCNTMVRDEADIVLGSRMGPESRMPRVRRIGNTIFATLLGALSRQTVSDSASGMRVVRRSALPRLLPLPTGLHFTPAMSAKALMDSGIILKEIPMRYSERVGESKLSCIKDGLRFGREILSAVVYVKPSRITIPVAMLLAAICIGLAAFPVRFYAEHRYLPEWLIYRSLTILLLSLTTVTVLCATVIAEHAIALSQLGYDRFLNENHSWWGRRALRLYFCLGLASVFAATGLVWPGIQSLVTTGHIPPTVMHWSRVIVAAFFILTFLQMIACYCLLRIMAAMHDRQRFLIGERSDGLRRARIGL